ncbi:xylulokinase [Vibrio sinensis]|uniref:Xylulose kinase n=1 Tax=Vibrio sinensis TaxID=2302434 RepID=A0A3A6QSC8_9VIBR|nr:xylulokinase [Vibrio sinensis]RJX75675.1 xylulokinase [Vibrio sinensis]
MYLGIDLGTSGIKAILLNEQGEIIASEVASLTVSRPHELWSEQNPEDWWQTTNAAIKQLGDVIQLNQVKAIGLSGQMHGAVTLDKQGSVIRPAILWNDGRSAAECIELEQLVPNSRHIAGNIMMPGFTAPKLKWLQKNEPYNFALIDKVLLPKDYLRYRMSGIFASDLSDSAGTLWLDVAKRDWSDELLAACSLTREHMPQLFEGNEITGLLSETVASSWGMDCVPIVAGAGDNAAGAIGMGITEPEQAMLSLGTSGVYFAVGASYTSNPESAVHSFCHALPNTWHLMSVILSAAACLDWVAKLTHYQSVPEMLEDVEQSAIYNRNLVFLPYLSGERTPHNDPNAKGVFFGMTHETNRADLALAVLEGVGFAFADGLEAMNACELKSSDVTLIGGGARSEFWRQMLADITGQTLSYREGGDVGPALGAARLAQLGVNPQINISDICLKPALIQTHQPCLTHQAKYREKHQLYKQLYSCLKPVFNSSLI